ncbi:MAG TPA: cellulase family glycosylhydrolase, partial [Paludibacter sp.]|nr:cellulase family glycosylhydrolase [Paludibacter sp.]
MKKNTTFSLFFNKRFLFTVLALGLIISASASAKLPTAQKIAGKMTVGWNLGNTLEAIGGEAAWGAGHTSQQLIDSVKAAGFNTVRLPVSWFIHSDTVTSVIDKEWMARVKEVVDYCINNDMYVILNMHWDKGWLENRVNKANQDIVNKRQRA